MILITVQTHPSSDIMHSLKLQMFNKNSIYFMHDILVLIQNLVIIMTINCGINIQATGVITMVIKVLHNICNMCI